MTTTSVHKEKGKGKPLLPLIVAHRGASRDAVENTVPAFELAWEQHADAIETDIHLTADGQIVCVHDAVITSNGRRFVVSESGWDDLRQIDLGRTSGSPFQHVRIPTLAEALETVPPGKRIFIEVKCGPEILPPLCSVIYNSGLDTAQVSVISFHQTVVKAVKQQAPDFTTLLLCSFETDPGTRVAAPTIDYLLNVLRAVKANGLSTQDHPAVTSDFMQRLRAAGYDWHVWTVDDPQRATAYMELGVDSITTNSPGRMRETLNAWARQTH